MLNQQDRILNPAPQDPPEEAELYLADGPLSATAQFSYHKLTSYGNTGSGL